MSARFSPATVVATFFLSFGSFAGSAERVDDPKGAAAPATTDAIFGQGVRETPWLSPQDELAGFHLAPGFEARLFAAEPEIAKPLNMAFDDRGRMWLTQSVEYPYPAKDGVQPRDSVVILEDKDGDGTADDVQTFADSLNIPIGILPFGDGCLCFSIPNLLYLRDTDGDGRCDKREVILGPFDTTRDTHGMINSLRDGGDGWIYACHGFNNQSLVSGRDGHEITMHSGNTFRFRPDGSRVEHVTHGQVNPFGMTQDQWGYFYSADCHSKPITQLIYGACYPSFGKPHDGLGFLPPMIDHLHGSTAICGVQYYSESSRVEPLRGQILSGNVMTSRINRNSVTYDGATAKGVELSDFMTSDDPWFRPVDLRRGPNGHLYVADFYNKIIGHYEVPLDHPDRDRTSGRIWQIRFVGRDPTNPPSSVDGRDGAEASIAKLREGLRTGTIHGPELVEATTDDDPRVRVAAIRLSNELASRNESERELLAELASEGIDDGNPHFARASAELIGMHGSIDDLPQLQRRLARVPQSDVVQRQTIRIALRALLRKTSPDDSIWETTPDAELASVMLGLDRAEASAAILAYLQQVPDATDRDMLLGHAARNASADTIDMSVEVAKRMTEGRPARQFELISVLLDSLGARANDCPPSLRAWAMEIASSHLSSTATTTPLVAWAADDAKPWANETRSLPGGGSASLTSSLSRGETYTGRRVSDEFDAPATVSFFLAGHNGFPDQPDHGKNMVRMVLLSDGRVIKQATPPRNDRARKVTWDLSEFEGQSVRIECIDGDNGTAYAWIATGSFEPTWLDQSHLAKRLAEALNLIRRVGLGETRPALLGLVGNQRMPRSIRLQFAQTLATLDRNRAAEVLLATSLRSGAPAETIESMIEASVSDDASEILEPTKQLCKRLSQQDQIQFASEWGKAGADTGQLIQFARNGWISPSVFVAADVAQVVEARGTDAQKTQIQQMTKDLSVDEAKVALLTRLQKNVTARNADLARGKSLYTKHCGACHQLRGEGAVVGPQLDGAATRSIERLLEDVVLPSRNVDHAFRTSSFLLDDGRVVNGLVTNETDRQVTLVDSSGKSMTIKAASIEKRQESGRSLMPENMGDVLATDELRDLLIFLKRGTPTQ